MSAWIVSKRLIDYIITTARKYDTPGMSLTWHVPFENPKNADWHALSQLYQENRRELNTANYDDLGRMLWYQNFLSVAYRYGNRNSEALPGSRYETYKFEHYEGVDIVTALKQINCYQYQSSETPEWKNTEAYAFTQALKEHLIEKLPGYEEAPWGIE